MLFKKLNFFRSKEFKLFLTIWIIYVFYLQMIGSSHMATSQSALTASIVNEQRFEIDTYYRATAGGVSFYEGHYYSIQAPGISFISVPLYVISKPFFYIMPQETVDYIFTKLEKYGETLPADFLGNKKILSNYFPNLNKRQILEYVFISGFILPILTTALISALSCVLVYMLLKRFTNNEKLRIIITVFYAFGTFLFPLSTEFFQRPIAIALVFTSFFILFKIKHKELKPKGSTLFASGILAGLSAWFDYFHLFMSVILFLYLVSFYRQKQILKFVVGVSIPVLLLFSYNYIIFDNPFTQSYAYSVIPEDVHKVSEIFNIKFPSVNTLLSMFEFLVYSPIIILALYGVYKALLKKDKYYYDVLFVLGIIIITFTYCSVLTFVFPSPETFIAQSFKRYMTPILPFIFIFMPYIFANDKHKKRRIKTLFIIIGIVSILFSWTAAQYGGHQSLSQYDLNQKRFLAGADFIKNGPSSSFLHTLAGIFNINPLPLNLIGLAILISLIYIIWRPYLGKYPGNK